MSTWHQWQRVSVEVVVRHLRLEGLDLKDIVTQVKGWKNREGVVVRFADGTMVKVKSRWWASCGERTSTSYASCIWIYDMAGDQVRRWRR